MKSPKYPSKLFNKIPTTKISLIKVNKKNIFDTSNILINKRKQKQKNISNHRANLSYAPSTNTEFFSLRKINPSKKNNEEQINIMKLQMSCNILNQKINQLRNFSREIDSYSYDKVKRNQNSTNINETAAENNIINEKGFNNTQKLNLFNCYNDKRSVFPISNLKNMNTTTKKFFHYPKLSFNEDISLNNIRIRNNNKNNINKIITNKKKCSFTNYNNYINKINRRRIDKNLIRNKKLNPLSSENESDMNSNNNYTKYYDTERKLINFPSMLNDAPSQNNIKKRIDTNCHKKMQNYIYYNKKLNKSEFFHKRFYSYGLNNNYSDINCKSQHINLNINKDSSNINRINMDNNRNQNRIEFKYYGNEKNRCGIGNFDNFFLKDKSLFFIENSCNYNIVNQNSMDMTPRVNDMNRNKLQIQEGSKLNYFTPKNEIKFNNKIIEKKFEFNYNRYNQKSSTENILVPINSVNFTLNDGNKIKEIKDNKINNINDKQNKKLDEINNNKNIEQNTKIKKEDNSEDKYKNLISEIKINEKDTLEELKIEKADNINDMNMNENMKDSLSENNDIIIHSEKESDISNFLIKDTTQGRIIITDSEKEKEIKDNKENKEFKENKENNKNKGNKSQGITKSKNCNQVHEESPFKSDEEEIFDILLERIRQNNEMSEKTKEEKKSKSSSNLKKKKVYFDSKETNFILYDINKPAYKIEIYDNQGNKKKFIPIKINDYKKKLNNRNMKLKSNLKNCPKINYKKIMNQSSSKNVSTKNIKNQEKNKKFKKFEISPKKSNSIKWKKHIHDLCDDIIKSIVPISERGALKHNSIKKDKEKIGNKTKEEIKYIGRNKLKNNYEGSIEKLNNNKEIKKNKEMKRKKAKEKILSAIEDIKKYFEEMD